MGTRCTFSNRACGILRPALLAMSLLPVVAMGQVGPDVPVEVPVFVGFDPAIAPTTMAQAQKVASEILAHADVRLTWTSRFERASISVDFTATPGPAHSGEALAFTFPYDPGGPQIHILYDRILPVVRDCPRLGGILLGHVLAHEIIHVLERIDRHSPTGVMKPRWGSGDYVEMQVRPLPLAGEDVRLIRMGLKSWFIHTDRM